MAVLLQKDRRRCDSTCHTATRPLCRCICGGKHHGVGRAEAERRLDHLRRLLAEAVSRARAALSGGLEAVGLAEAWLGGAREEGGEGGGAGVFDGVGAP